MITYDHVETPIGPLWIAVSSRGLCRIEFEQPADAFVAGLHRAFSDPCVRDADGIAAARLQVQEYLAGRRRAFDLPVDLTGTPPFHRSALAACRAIPYGETCSYAELATALGRHGGARAVGNAMSCNPIPLVYPCHRVLRTDGSLGGFRGGVSVKEWLLRMEAGVSAFGT
jgi:methylated-DNA-[protein]-cysteine S-methyltransferase